MLSVVLPLIPAICTLMIWSYLYKYNPVFKFAEHTVVGIGAGVTFYMSFRTIITTGVDPVMKGVYFMLPALLLGPFVFGTFHPKTRWYGTLPIAILLAIGFGLAVRGTIIGQIIDQVRASMVPITTPNMVKNFENLVVIVGTVTSLLYFVFTREQKGAFGVATRLGRYFVMIAMGTTYASLLLTNFSGAMGPMFTLMESPGIYLTAIAVLLVMIDIGLSIARKEKK